MSEGQLETYIDDRVHTIVEHVIAQRVPQKQWFEEEVRKLVIARLAGIVRQMAQQLLMETFAFGKLSEGPRRLLEQLIDARIALAKRDAEPIVHIQGKLMDPPQPLPGHSRVSFLLAKDVHQRVASYASGTDHRAFATEADVFRFCVAAGLKALGEKHDAPSPTD